MQVVTISLRAGQTGPGKSDGGRAHRPAEEILAHARERISSETTRVFFRDGSLWAHPELSRIIAAIADQSRAAIVAEARPFEVPEVIPDAVLREKQLVYRILFPHFQQAPFDSLTRRHGSYEKTLTLLRRLLSADQSVELVLPLTQAPMTHLEPTMEMIKAEFQGIWKVILDRVPEGRYLADGFTSPTFGAIANDLYPRVRKAAKALGLRIGYTEEWLVPFCAGNPGAGHFVPSRSPGNGPRPDGGYRRIAACEGCYLIDRCAGIPAKYLEAHGEGEFAAVPETAHIDIVAAEEQCRESRTEPHLPEFQWDQYSVFHKEGSDAPEAAVFRVNYSCNMTCQFCFVNINRTVIPYQTLRQRIATTLDPRIQLLSLSGGEPTLHPELGKVIADVKARGIPHIEIQTNGLMLAKRERVKKLREAGLTRVLLALHGVTDEVTDYITGVPGGLQTARQALQHMLDEGLETRVNFVLCRWNSGEVLPFVQWFEQLQKQSATPLHLQISFSQPTRLSFGEERQVYCRYEEIREPLKQALDYCLERDIPFTGPEGECGVPYCTLDGDPRYFPAIHQKADKALSNGSLRHVPACDQCDLQEVCPGINSKYLTFFGDQEFKPVRTTARREG